MTAVEIEFGDQPLGSTSHDECARYLAAAYADQEDLVALKEIRERVLERAGRSKNNDISLRFALRYLASVESQIGEIAAAERHNREALALAEKALRHSLGQILGTDPDPAEPLASAVDRATHAVNIASETVYISNLTTVADDVADILLDLGDESDALRLLRSHLEFERAVHAHEERKPPTDSPFDRMRYRFDGYAWMHLGKALERIGQYNDAWDSYREAWTVHGDEQGETSYDIALSMARCQHSLGRDSDALSWLERAEAAGIVEPPRHGATSPCDTFWRLQALADLSADCGATESADRLYRRGMEIEAAAHGVRHPLVSAAAYNYALFLQRQNRTEEALALADMALEIGAGAWGEGAPRTAKRRALVEELRQEIATE